MHGNQQSDWVFTLGGEIELRLDELLGQLGSVFQEAMDRLDKGDVAEVLKERSFNSARGPIRASAGVRIRTAGQASAASTSNTEARRPDQPINTPQPAPPRTANQPNATYRRRCSPSPAIGAWSPNCRACRVRI
jgi:hypothetical protein